MMQQVQACLRNCSYQYIEEVNKACYSITNLYPGLKPNLIQQRDGNFTRNLLELQGDIDVLYKQQKYGIQTKVFFPYMYPTAPAVIKIVNIDQNKFRVSDRYKQGLQSDGTVIVYLSELQNWAYHRDPIKLLKQLQKQLGEHFPFFANTQKQNNSNFQQQQGFNQNQNQNYLNSNNSSNNNSNFGQPGFNQPVNPLQGIGQGGFNQPPINNNFNQQNNNQQVMAQLQNKVGQQLSQVAMKMKSDAKDLKKQLDDAYNTKSELDGQDIKISQIELDLATKSSQIENEINDLQKFVDENDSKTVNGSNINEFLEEADPLSEQIISLMAENQSLADSTVLIENAFNKGIIDFNEMIQLIRSYGNKEFDNKILLKKCIKSAQEAR
ncbi:Ubiquitin-conjugating enzyme/RWD-like protein [Pseudocohnilembus persalinus]|uniref:Ubiquitin-conjugating enzyme/RWD-like protein n=1 Tax=Pseudocohnilembus persalinus TaxID=266149 RepID=A0A0V0R635_PSEPJ|nr:Ubiquitin-conjugating enzyme/RWD-like protein [Pseudocohnilembus persalinus]|eukprot:KRX09939.1 Ubiquitin-conjugating enzyme/RWD-like protein [Pseudocohnilembus persalinus]